MGYAMKQREGGREGAEEERETKRKREGGRVEERKTRDGSSGELAGIRGLGWMG